MSRLCLFLFVALVALAAGCTENSVTDNSGSTSKTVTWSTPTVGTVFIYQYINTLPNSIDTKYDTITVIPNGPNLLGKSNVFETADRYDTTLNHPEANGDISTADLLSPDPQWSLFPTGGGAANSEPVVDSMRSDGAHIRVTATRSFVGQETMSVLTKSYATLHTIEIDSNISMRASDSLYDIRVTTTDIWFIPQIGSYGKMHITMSDRSTHNATGYTTSVTLIGYFPK